MWKNKKIISSTNVNEVPLIIAKFWDRNFSSCVSFRTINNLGNMIKNNTDKTEKQNRLGVHEITCTLLGTGRVFDIYLYIGF